jgi:hypothetical protein
MITQCQVSEHLRMRSERGLPLITFYFYQTDHFVSQKRVFFTSKFSVKFEKIGLI